MFELNTICNCGVETNPLLRQWIDRNIDQIHKAIEDLKKSTAISDGILLDGAPEGFKIAKVFIFKEGEHPAEFHPNSTQVSCLFEGQLRFDLESRTSPQRVSNSRSLQSFHDDPECFVRIEAGVAHRPRVLSHPAIGIVFHTDPKVGENSKYADSFDQLFLEINEGFDGI